MGDKCQSQIDKYEEWNRQGDIKDEELKKMFFEEDLEEDFHFDQETLKMLYDDSEVFLKSDILDALIPPNGSALDQVVGSAEDQLSISEVISELKT